MAPAPAPMTQRVVVIGGGMGGATAALRLARAGCQVVLVEAGARLGGLVVSFEVQGTPLECFYHHVFPHEQDIVGLIDELGLSPKLEWRPSSMGVYADGRVWPFTTPMDLLRFRPLRPLDRLRAGVGALRLSREKEWGHLDEVRALDWLTQMTGPNVVRVVWDPLLGQKFGSAAGQVPAAWMWGRVQQRNAARGTLRGSERLGYLRGGFRQLFDALDDRLRHAGVDVEFGKSVASIAVDADRAAGVFLADGSFIEADDVLFTGPLPRLAPLLPPLVVDPRWAAIGSLGAVCIIVELAKPLQSQYWVNVCDSDLPFGGIIEHTNLLPASDYGGHHLVYLSRYFTAGEPIATVDLAEEARRWMAVLHQRFLDLGPADVLGVHPFRTAFAAPLVQVGYRSLIPPRRSHLPGLWVSTTAQIYPQDRGMSEGVRLGTKVAAEIVASSALPAPTGRPG